MRKVTTVGIDLAKTSFLFTVSTDVELSWCSRWFDGSGSQSWWHGCRRA